MLNDLAKLVAINSIYDTPAENAPFGKANRAALDAFLAIAAEYGLTIASDGGYAGWAEYGERGPLIGMLGHLDVVPAGEGWSSDPFRLTAENGRLYGRGVSDDKGPVVACLHALKKLKDENADLGCRVRLIVGCNEETGSECIKHYVRHCEVPVASFTPDSDFPVVASEKGIAHLQITLPASDGLAANFAEISGGTRANIVPNLARAVVRGDSPLGHRLAAFSAPCDILRQADVAERLATDGCDLADYAFVRTADGLTVTATGTAAHGSTPEKGDNALRKITSLLSALTRDAGLAAVNEYFASPYATERLGIDTADETGKMTLNLGVLRLQDAALALTVDLRLPKCADLNAIKSKLAAHLPQGARIEVLHNAAALAFPEDDALVQTLLRVYREVTGDRKSRPLHLGGGTYAKELPNCVGFGAVFPGMETHMHEPDEFYPVEELYKLTEIYYRAIKALCTQYGV